VFIEAMVPPAPAEFSTMNDWPNAAELVGHRAPDQVEAAAGVGRHDDLHRLGGIRLRDACQRQQ
jgi:hypothetical protein